MAFFRSCQTFVAILLLKVPKYQPKKVSIKQLRKQTEFLHRNMTDISFSTLYRLLKVIGLATSWESLMPELPESPYTYDDKGKKMQRVRHRKS